MFVRAALVRFALAMCAALSAGACSATAPAADAPLTETIPRVFVEAIPPAVALLPARLQ